MSLKHFSREGLSKRINMVVSLGYLCDNHVPSMDYLSDEMIFALNMFSSFMASGFFRICNCTTVVTIKCNWQLHIWNNFQIYQELSKPYCLFGCFTSSYIFCFHCRV